MQRSLVSAIIASHATEPAREGEICKVRVDFAFANDITAAPAVAGDTLVVVTRKGGVYGFRPD